MLQSAPEFYRASQRRTALGVLAARRAYRNGDLARLLAIITAWQLVAARHGAESVPTMLAEQDIVAPESATVNVAALAGVASDGRSLRGLVEQAGTETALDTIVRTQLQDASRTAAGLSITSRLGVTGYVRYVNTPSCGRCVVLANRFYRYSTGFLRHPRCDCQMLPTTEARSTSMTTDPAQLVRDGQVTGLSRADTQAIADGADVAQTVNVRRTGAGLTVGGQVLERGGRLTPAGIYRLASSRAEAISMLRQFKYLT